MFAKVSEKITDILVDNQNVDSQSRELYQFGIEQGFTIILNLITTLVIGLLFDMVWQIVLFMVAYIPLRSFCGGVHAKTPLRCYFASIVLLVAVELAVKHVILNSISFMAVYFISSFIMVFLSPVEDLNKPLDSTEIEVYKHRTVTIWFIESILIWLLFILNFKTASFCILLVILVLSVMLLLGVLKNMIIKRY